MRILLLGDVVGSPGRRAVARFLRVAGGWDLVVANGENASGGIGITPGVADELLSSGIRILTSGNHIWAHREILEYIDGSACRLLRPANMPPGNPGRGFAVLEVCGLSVMVLNLQGRVFIGDSDCPFRTADRILESHPADVVLVDFHAEATSEKEALGRYLDGRVTLFAGTHTHVQTADMRILPKGTVYVTDLGMCGSTLGVIGVRYEEVRERFLTGRPSRLAVADGAEAVCGIEVELDGDGRPVSRRMVNERV